MLGYLRMQIDGPIDGLIVRQLVGLTLLHKIFKKSKLDRRMLFESITLYSMYLCCLLI